MAKASRLLIDRYFNTLNIPDDSSTYVVMYTADGKKPPKEFYQHLARLKNRGLIEKFVPGSVICRGRKTAIVIKMIAERYSIRTKVFKVVEVV